MRERGFTFVEVMIVVLIIGLLAVMALPYFTRSRETTRKSVCINGLRIISDAKEQWAMEHSKSGGDTPVKTELTPDYIRHYPACPSGAEPYDIRPVIEEPLCPNTTAFPDHMRHFLPPSEPVAEP